MIPNKDLRWKTKAKGYENALNNLQARLNGKIISIKTSSVKINDATCDGFEWHTAVCIAARPGAGKSVLKEQIINESFELNPLSNHRCLDFDLEMPLVFNAIREFSAHLGKSYKYMCSAEMDADMKKLTKEELQKCYLYSKQRLEAKADGTSKYPIDVVEDAPTVNEFEQIVTEYMEYYATTDNKGNKVYTNTIVSMDHARLFIKAPFENGEQEMLHNLGKAIIRLKKKFPILFIILNHLNRNIDKPERVEEGRYGNYVLESDILGSDSFSQCCDIIIGINRPAKLQIRQYGPQRYIIQDDMVLVFHFLKVRNGTPRMSFFRGEFHRMKIVEMDTPATAQKAVSTGKNIQYVEPVIGEKTTPLEANNLFTTQTHKEDNGDLPF